MSIYWSARVHTLSPYIPGEQPRIDGLIKLNTNENPYPPSPQLITALRAHLDERLRLYPDPHANELKTVLAERHGLTPAQVFVGNGSDEVLAHAFFALLKHEKPLWLPDISYSFYQVYCRLHDITSRTIALDKTFAIQPADYFPSANDCAGGIVLANPNAPTGRFLPLSAIQSILEHNPQCVVLVDEAYIDFGGQSAIALVNRYPNLLVVHTLSKSRALAGLRVGFALAQPPLIEALERVKDSFNSYPLDRLAQAGAVAAIADEAYFRQQCARIIASRKELTAQLQHLGFEVLPSQANFIFARHPGHDAKMLAQTLRENAILVRHFPLPRIEQFLRISIGSEQQCHRLLQVLRTLLA